MNLLAELRARFAAALANYTADVAPYAAMVKPSQDPRFGDYQANCAMPLSKQAGRNARELAAELVGRLDLADLCQPPEIAGPGFINLRLRDDLLERLARQIAGDERMGVARVARPRRVVIDFSSPNVAKPMHVGHLRSTVIGDALARLLRFLGHEVLTDNHIGDWGTQFGMIIYGYKHFLDAAAYREAPVKELARLYRLVNQLADYHELKEGLPGQKQQLAELQATRRGLDESPVPAEKPAAEARKKQLKKLSEQITELTEALGSADKKIASVEGDPPLAALAAAHPRIAVLAREETARLHAGDEENRRLWHEFMPACLSALQSVYDRLGIRFDMALGESHYDPLLADVVADLRARGLAVENDGAICVFIPGVDAPFIVRKTDGAYTYATTDLATIRYRVDQFQADSMLYVVDKRQGDHFKLLFETARRWGYDSVEYQHISFGTVLGPDGRPYKTRSGDTVGLESLLDEGVAEARKLIEVNRDPAAAKLDPDASARVAEVVGLGAIKYADLCQNRETDYVFSWEKMLNTKGDTATYMQYAYARISGIVRKGEIDLETLRASTGELSFTHPAERGLALQLLRFSEALDAAAAEYRPNFITAYLFETANSFSSFYEQCPVLKADTLQQRSTRLLLSEITARVIKQGLALLGIETVDAM